MKTFKKKRLVAQVPPRQGMSMSSEDFDKAFAEAKLEEVVMTICPRCKREVIVDSAHSCGKDSRWKGLP